MRRRYDGSTPPPDLLVFEGHRFTTEAQWVAAFDEWCAARARWLSQRALPDDALPPRVVNGDCPFDRSSI